MNDELRSYIFARDAYRCRSCRLSVYRSGFPQIAHRIANTKANVKRYGKEVIDHPLNLAAACSLSCNAKMNIGFKTREADELAEKIRNLLAIPE